MTTLQVPGHQQPLAEADATRLALLSPRELEVLCLVAQGHSNAEIAAALVISVTTVKSHLAQLLRKLLARDRVALVVLAWREGVVAAPPTGAPQRPRGAARPGHGRCTGLRVRW
ncbi:response regulator transcription factor [Nocardioides sp. GY 10113]|uniref:response regulator transcription factor n=1 Tax=Nocardioides sp. GY 10113 TaxID=2569761 RepID=UPI0010A7D1FD|nr:LuxR C-terminal-related transcriptional regulator [Nocardioides sp. GY 10113]TIC83564.1 response regulator transcription factor [Nocardioides sp. GY 10113]